MPKHGVLRLSIPDGWSVESEPVRDPAAAAIRLKSSTGSTFDIQITAVWLDAQKLKKTDSEAMKASTLKAGKGLLSQSVEKEVSLKEINGAQAHGWYYALTDPKPAPGEFKYLTQGSFLTGEMLCAFTILHRNSDTPEATQALQAFAGAVHVK